MALFYLLLMAGGETLQHAWGDPAPSHAEAHVHATGDGDHDCPPPPHDETHCPACKLAGLHFLPSAPAAGVFAGIHTAAPVRAVGDVAPAPRSHAPPSTRAPPLG